MRVFRLLREKCSEYFEFLMTSFNNFLMCPSKLIFSCRYTPPVVGGLVFIARYASVANIRGAVFAARRCCVPLVLRMWGRIPFKETIVINVEAADGVSMTDRTSVGGEGSALQLR